MANRILLADDSITIQKVVNLTFTDEGIDVVTVGNGELALKKLREEHFDLVLADIFMPGRNGYEVCEFIKTQPAYAHMPVLLLVGAFEPFDRSEAGRVRADGHLTKPFESRTLVETVKRLLAQIAPRPEVAPQQEAAPRPESGHAGAHGPSWDVPPVVEQSSLADDVPPPPYDPYASTAKLPPIHAVSPRQEPPQELAGNSTMVIGSPFAASGESHARTEAESAPSFDLEGSFDMSAQEEPAREASVPDQDAYVSEAPAPDRVPTTGELASPAAPAGAGSAASSSTEGDADYASSVAAQSFGYKSPNMGDSPLELPDDMGVVEHHQQETPYVPEVRDPLLDTFADVADATARVDAAPDPDFQPTAREDDGAALNVRPVDGIVSAWDNEAQPAPSSRWEDERPSADEPRSEASLDGAADAAYGSAEAPAYGDDGASGASTYDASTYDAVGETAGVSTGGADAFDVAATEDDATGDRAQVYSLDLPPFESSATETEVSVPSSFDAGAGVDEAPSFDAETGGSIASGAAEATSESYDAASSAPSPFGASDAASYGAGESAGAGEAYGADRSYDDRDRGFGFGGAPSDAFGGGSSVFSMQPPPISDEPLTLDASAAEEGYEAYEAAGRATVEAVQPTEADGARGGAYAGETHAIIGEAPAAEGGASATDYAGATADYAGATADSVGAAVDDETHDDTLLLPPTPGDLATDGEDTESDAASRTAGAGVAESGELLAIPSDIIDEVVRRTLERMSDDVIREIAWEVVPALAERLIRKRLSES